MRRSADRDASSAEAILARAGALAGLSVAGAVLLRVGTNVLYRLPADDAVIRIGSPAAWRAAVKEVHVGRWLEGMGIPAVRAVAGLAQPLLVEGAPVTVWHWLPPDEEAPSPADLGRILRRLHEADADGLALEPFDPFASARRDLEAAHPGVDRPVIAYLEDEIDRLAGACIEVARTDAPVPLHGDAHTGNLLRSRSKAVLLDLETFAVGPRAWDLVPTAVRFERFGLPASAYEQFAEAYGVDVRSARGYEVLRRVRELVITCWLLPRAGQPELAAELRHRVATLRDGGVAIPWTAR